MRVESICINHLWKKNLVTQLCCGELLGLWEKWKRWAENQILPLSLPSALSLHNALGADSLIGAHVPQLRAGVNYRGKCWFWDRERERARQTRSVRPLSPSADQPRLKQRGLWPLPVSAAVQEFIWPLVCVMALPTQTATMFVIFNISSISILQLLHMYPKTGLH